MLNQSLNQERTEHLGSYFRRSFHLLTNGLMLTLLKHKKQLILSIHLKKKCCHKVGKIYITNVPAKRNLSLLENFSSILFVNVHSEKNLRLTDKIVYLFNDELARNCPDESLSTRTFLSIFS